MNLQGLRASTSVFVNLGITRGFAKVKEPPAKGKGGAAVKGKASSGGGGGANAARGRQDGGTQRDKSKEVAKAKAKTLSPSSSPSDHDFVHQDHTPVREPADPLRFLELFSVPFLCDFSDFSSFFLLFSLALSY